MIGQQTIDVERKTTAILKLLSDSPRPLGGRIIARRLGELGIDLGERAVRYHLKLMDERGLTCPVGRKDGRLITKLGLDELDSALVSDRVGLVSTRIGTLAYKSSFDTGKRSGEVPVNVSLFSMGEFGRAMEVMEDTFLAGFGMGELVAIAAEGERFGGVTVPAGKVGMVTLSHIMVCSALLRVGVPVNSRFGGIVQVRNNCALRFVELIEYAGCSMDPSEVFIASGMTSVCRATSEGNGRILASLYEIPALARPAAEMIVNNLETDGIKGLVMLGKIGEPVCQIPVEANSVGMVLADGLNPVAAAAESGMSAVNYAMSGVADFEKLQNFSDCQPAGGKACSAC